jgi:hypothetical protein
MEVRKTMTKLDWDLKIQRLRKIPTLQKIIPSKNSLPGLCSALNGVINDSKTMVLIFFFPLYKPFGSKRLN